VIEIWLAILGCLTVSFVFSGIEAGILSVNRVRLRHRLKLKDPAAKVLNKLLADPERTLVTVLIVTNLMNICALSLGVQMAVSAFGHWGYFLSLVVALPIWMLGIELLPKSVFRRVPYTALAFLSGPLRLADYALSPMHALGGRLTRPLFLKRPAQRLKLFGGREDFKYLTFISEKDGTITAQERGLIHSVIDFRNLTAQQAMVPIEQVGCIASTATLLEARDLARSLGVDRLPVRDDQGDICGILDLHELAVRDHWHGRVDLFQRRILRADLQDSAYGLLRKLRAARIPMATVRNASKEIVGMVMWDDLVRILLSSDAPSPTDRTTKAP
jgi:CBS domain containing-hemolysin-like protein